jgi:hypothetical protein
VVAVVLAPQYKLAAAVVSEVALILGVTTAQTDPSGFISGNVFDAGTTIAALGLLAYILRQLLGGDLVSKSTIDSVVEKAVRETLRECDRDTRR